MQNNVESLGATGRDGARRETFRYSRGGSLVIFQREISFNLPRCRRTRYRVTVDLVNLGGPPVAEERQQWSLSRLDGGRGNNRHGGNSTRGHPLVPSLGRDPINTRPLRTLVCPCARASSRRFHVQLAEEPSRRVGYEIVREMADWETVARLYTRLPLRERSVKRVAARQ